MFETVAEENVSRADVSTEYGSFKFGGKVIGENEPVFIIAECGINHGGSVDIAADMIRKAAESGADAVKFQTYITEKRVPKESPIFDLLKDCELNSDAHHRLYEVAQKSNIEFFSTPFDTESVALLEEIGVPGYKIASFDIVNLSLMRSVGKIGKPVICSTGMADEAEVLKAKEILSSYKIPFALLHCISAYPTKEEDANLSVIHSLQSLYSGPIGYSDHTLGIEVPILAVASGAKVIEKHFTLNKTAVGPDHKLSADPDELKRMVNGIRRVEVIMGDSKLGVAEPERNTLVFRRQSK